MVGYQEQVDHLVRYEILERKIQKSRAEVIEFVRLSEIFPMKTP